MSRTQQKRVEEIESQTQYYSSSKPVRLGRINSTSKPNYQWVSSTKVSSGGRGGDTHTAVLPPPALPSDRHSSVNIRSSSVKKSDGQGGQSTAPRANSVSNADQNAPFGKSQLSGTSDASTYKPLSRSTSQYRKEDNQIVSGALSPQSQSESSDSATTRTPLRGDPSSRTSLQNWSSQEFAEEMKADHNSFKRETTTESSSVSSKQQKKTILEKTKNDSPQLQPEDLGESKNGPRHLRPKAKSYIRMDHNYSKPGEIDQSSMSRNQLPVQDKNQSKNKNPHLQPKCDLEPSKNESLLQSKGNPEYSKKETPDFRAKDDLEHCKSQTPYPRPRTKRYNAVQRKLSKQGATVPMSSVSSKQEAKWYVDQFNTRTPNLKAGGNFEEYKDETLHPQPMFKRYIEVHRNFVKPELTVSSSYISGRQQQKRDLKQSRKETPNIQPEAERDAQDVTLADTEMPVATSSYQPSHNYNHLGIPGHHTWTQGMAPTAFQMPIQFPSGNTGQFSQPPFLQSFQPYHPLSQGVMHYGDGYNFSYHVGHQLGSEFGTFNAISSNYLHNYLRKSASRTPVKITHPETNEELILDNIINKRLDGGSSEPTSNHPVMLQPHPVAYGPSAQMNYFSHVQPNSFSFQSPTSVSFGSSKMLPRTSKLGFNSLGMHDVATATNTEHFPLTSFPASKQASIFAGQNKAPVSVSVRSANNGRHQATKPIDAVRVGSEREESNCYSKGSVELPKSVAESSLTAIPLGTSSGTVSLGKGASISIDDDDDQRIEIIDSTDAAMKEFQNLSRKSPQAETSGIPGKSIMEALEDGECCNNPLTSQMEIQQPDAVSRPPLSLEPGIPGGSKVEMVDLESNHSPVDSHESSVVHPYASVEETTDFETEKDLIQGVSSKYICQDVSTDNAIAPKGAEICHRAPILIQVGCSTEELSEHQGTNPFEQPFLHNICTDGNVNNLRSLEVNQQTTEDTSIAETAACDKHAISAEETGDVLARCTPSLSCGTDSMSGFPTLDSSQEYLEVGLKANINLSQIFSFSKEENVGAKEDVKGKTERELREGFEISTSELEKSNKSEENTGDAASDGTESSTRKIYSRDFLLTFSKQFNEFPADFQFEHDMAEALIMNPKASVTQVADDNSYPSFIRNMDWSAGSSSIDNHGHRKNVHHRWTKFETEQNFGIHGEGSNPSHGGGTYKGNLHGQVPGQYASGIFTGLLPNPASQRGRIHKADDAHQWQRARAFQKDLISSPRSSSLEMHKAEKKYEVNKVMDAEEAKQRQLKAILNKLTPQNFERLFQQVKEVNIDNAITLAGLISQIFDKSLMEPTFCEMYASFCYHLASELPDFLEGDEKITFKRQLLNKCQEEFEKGESEQAEADRKDMDGAIVFSVQDREEKRILARRRMLGNIRLIGELYKKKMLTERIMHECIEKLLRNDQLPEEEDIEALCQLMCTIGEIIDHPKAKEYMDAYFDVMLDLSNNGELSTRMRFLLKDVIDLRKNNWQQRRKVEGPKKIEELHSEAAREQRAVASQLTHPPSTFSNKRVSTDSGSRPSTFRTARKSERGPFRANSSRNHGSTSQDARSAERKIYQHRTSSVPFPHRSAENNIMTFGPQGGFTKGMSVRDPTMFYGSPLTGSHTGFEEFMKVPAETNGFSSIPEWKPHTNLKRQPPKYAPNVFMQAPVYDPPNRQVHDVNREPTSADGSFQSSVTKRPTLSSNVSSGNIWSNENLREMSLAAIREFYRVGNENEIFQCVGDLNSPSFYPSMISIWVMDSFERKDRERDLLSGLLVSLTTSKAGVLDASQLIKGFELVLANLEVTFTDAAKAATFLGQLFGRIVTKNVLFLKEIKRMMQQYDKAPDDPRKDKLGYVVMKITFETIRSEKGESVLKDVQEFKGPVG